MEMIEYLVLSRELIGYNRLLERDKIKKSQTFGRKFGFLITVTNTENLLSNQF